MSNEEILFTPFKIGNIEVPNRFVETAVTGTEADHGAEMPLIRENPRPAFW